MTRAVYTGHEALTFPGYIDLESGQTLHAEPGGTYDIAPASGNAGDEVPFPWFVAADAGAQAAAEAARAAAEAERLAAENAGDGGEPGGEPGPGGEDM